MHTSLFHVLSKQPSSDTLQLFLPSMLTSNEEGSNFIQNLPPEVLTLIFGNLTIYELAKVQKTCKAWYAIAQKTPTLWRKSAPFFRKFYKNLWEIPKFVRRVQALSRLSAGKLDEIIFSLSEENEGKAEIASFLESIPSFNPTSLQIEIYGDSDKYLQIIGRCKSLCELNLHTYNDTPFKNKVFKDCPIQEAKLEKLTLDHNSFREWRSDESCLSVSSSIKTLILEDYQGFDVAHTLDFLYHCRQSIEDIDILGISYLSLRRGVTGLHQEIIFPNLVKARFTHCEDRYRTDDELIPFHCFKCPQIQELCLSNKYFLNLFDSVESVKKVRLNWPVDDLAEIFRTFSNIETFIAQLHSEEMLRSLVDLVPKQLKHLNLTVESYTRYDDPFRMNPNKRATIYQLLELVRHSSAKRSGKYFRLHQEGEIEFCKIDVVYEYTETHLMVRLSMCKNNFIEIITALSKMKALDSSTQTSSIISSD